MTIPTGPELQKLLARLTAAELLTLARETVAAFTDETGHLETSRGQLFAMSAQGRRLAEFAIARQISELAWSLHPEDGTTGQPGEYDLLCNPRIIAAIAAIAAAKTVVFITGCARSGTSLQHRCLSTVHDPVYFWSENTLARLVAEWPCQGETVVLKRKSLCYQYFDIIPAQVKIVHMVRHPHGTITSTHPKVKGYYLDFDRWVGEFTAFQQLQKSHPAANLYISRYEELVEDADRAQDRMRDQLGIAFDLPFSRYTERNHLDKKITLAGQPRMWEPITPRRARSTETIRMEHKQRLDDFHNSADDKIQEFCKLFGYEAF